MFSPLAPAGDYRVVQTDYTGLAIVYSCTELPLSLKEEDLWILSRTQTVSDAVLNKAIETVKA